MEFKGRNKPTEMLCQESHLRSQSEKISVVRHDVEDLARIVLFTKFIRGLPRKRLNFSPTDQCAFEPSASHSSSSSTTPPDENLYQIVPRKHPLVLGV
jgi:hypothetical protein